MPNLIDLINKYAEIPAPISIESLIRELDIVLDKKADLADNIAGQIEKLPDGRYRISVNRKDHYFRQRFTMAHELGHFIYHRDLIGDGISDDRMYRSTNLQISESEETVANRFAANLLMPYKHIQKDFQELNGDVEKLAARWQVSPKAMKIRLEIQD